MALPNHVGPLPGDAKPIPGHPGFWAAPEGEVWSRVGRLTASVYRGRLRVHAPRTIRVHRLVAAAFLGPCPEGKEVNHIDGDKMNNRPENLEYVTHRENVGHAHANGLAAVGERHGAAKLNPAMVRSIFRLRQKGLYQREIADRYSVSRRTVRDVLAGKLWKHVSPAPTAPQGEKEST